MSNEKKIEEVIVSRMGVGGHVYTCPVKRALNILTTNKLPKNGTEHTCETCGEKHKIVHGRIKHFSNYL